jgi:molybdopterin molybdotransferase
MVTTYASARSKLENAASELQRNKNAADNYESLTLADAIGRVAARDYFSPVSTPEFDTSAMDGYAIPSEFTRVASPESPVFFSIQGTIAAGDKSLSISPQNGDSLPTCVEIMTGGRFPEGEFLDACVKVEDTIRMTANIPCVAISKPIPRYANRRFAGEDIQKGDIILRKGTLLCSSHIMPLASVGIDIIDVYRRVSVCVWSTGNELTSQTSHVRDVNGVYITAASKEAGASARFMGSIRDEVDALVHAISERLEASSMDIMITSGGVSVGKFDHVRQALEVLEGKIIFHGVTVRPGHPVLFALLPSRWGEVAFFGLPGNPGAAAACFNFLTVPYMRFLLGLRPAAPILARLQDLELGSSSRKSIMDAPNKGLNCDRFRPGVLDLTGHTPTVQEAAQVLGPAKMKPFVQANCWIHIKANDIVQAGQMVSCYPMNES